MIEKRLDAYYNIFAYFIMLFLGNTMIGLLIKLIFPNMESILLIILVNFITNLILAIYLVIKTKLDLYDSFEAFKSDLIKYIKLILIGMLLIYGVSFLNAIYLSLVGNLGEPSNNQESIIISITSSYGIIMIATVVILAPIVEEIVFRYSFFTLINNDKIAIIVSGVVFGGMHIILTLDFIYAPVYISSGLVFSYLYYKSDKNLIYIILLHSINNSISVIGILLSA